MRAASRRLGSLLVVGLLLAACDKQGGETNEPDVSDDPGSVMEGSEGQVGASTPAVAAGEQAKPETPLPKVQDRDPEEEKRKMAQSRAQSGKAHQALDSGKVDQAVTLARAALRIHEQNVDAMLVIAEAFYRERKYEIVQAVISSGLAVDAKVRTPAETSSLYNLQGFAFLKQNKEGLATQSFKKAAESDDKNAAAWNNLGTRYLEAGDTSTAASCFGYAVELDGRFYKAHLNLGAAQRALGKLKEAETSMMTALKLRPSYPEAYFNLGILYLDADPFPELDTTARLNKAISYLNKYKSTAAAKAHSTPSKNAGRPGMGPTEAATNVIADDYIRVAEKGIEREKRRLEREGPGAQPKRPTAAGGDDPAATPAAAGPDAGADEPDPEAQAPTAAAPQKPGGAPTPQKPGAAPSEPTAPQQPTPAPKQPAPSEPAAPKQPAPSKPAPSAPAPQKPSAPAPQQPSAPAPQKPAAPAPQQPAAPAPQQPTPQQPTPQKPAPQTPKQASLRAPPRTSSTSAPLRKNSYARGTRGVDSTLTELGRCRPDAVPPSGGRASCPTSHRDASHSHASLSEPTRTRTFATALRLRSREPVRA